MNYYNNREGGPQGPIHQQQQSQNSLNTGGYGGLGAAQTQQQRHHQLASQQMQMQKEHRLDGMSGMNSMPGWQKYYYPSFRDEKVHESPNEGQFDPSNFPVLSAGTSDGRGNIGVSGGSFSSTLIGSSRNGTRAEEDFKITSSEDFPALPGSNTKSQSNSDSNSQQQSQQSNGRDFLSLSSVRDGQAQHNMGNFAGGVGSLNSNTNNSTGAGSTATLLGVSASASGEGVNNVTSSAVGGVIGSSVSDMASATSAAATPMQSPAVGGMSAPVGTGLLASLNPASAAAAPVANNNEARFGLGGLLEIIRMTDKDLNALALGTDLTTFGLNLNSTESLFPTVSSPFTDRTLPKEPLFQTPPCYMMHPPSLKSDHLSKFQLETLFYMFYSMPKDILQACAAQELYQRDWRYHGELRVWLKPRSAQELTQSHPNVQFYYFDCNSWETRLFNAARGNVAAGLLSEEEVRVKVPQPGS